MIKYEESSFRDPSGFLFIKNEEIYRNIDIRYKKDYDMLINSGLYDRLLKENLIIPHQEINELNNITKSTYKVIKPNIVNHISYPYEWCFSQLKDAALTTLKIEKIAMEYGMSLKDSSAYNIQFVDGKPLLIDTLSFEIYKEGQPWVGYKQFCQHFYAPLVLIAYKDIRLNQLLKIYIDGIPLDLASKLLPRKTKLKFSIYTNIHLHAKTQKKYENKSINKKEYKISKMQFLALIDSLESAIKKVNWELENTEWGDYYNITNYTDKAFNEKKKLVEKYIDKINPNSVWDLGANTGIFSRIASHKGIETVAFDIDPVAVEKNYISIVRNQENNILPLLMDLTNPSSSIGWGNRERMSFKERKLPDMVLALALIHHLAISNNVPLTKIALFFSEICKYLIIEFVPKNDSQVQKLLSTREDIFNEYDEEHFDKTFGLYFNIMNKENIYGTERTLYLLKRKNVDI